MMAATSKSLPSGGLDFVKPEKCISPPSEARLAQPSDLPLLESWVNEYTSSFFGEVNVSYLLRKSHITLCIENEDAVVVGAIFVNDHPNVPSIPPCEWSNWIASIYRLEFVMPRNALFVHLALWNPNYTYTFLKPLLKSIFISNPFLEYILCVIPPKMYDLGWLIPHGTRILPLGFSDASKVQTLYLIIRQHYVNKFKIRRAVVEDNDDLVLMLHKNQKKLVYYYGEYYIAEMLSHPDTGKKFIVAEHEERAVAVLCLNEAVNVGSLNEAFELVPFYGLKKPHTDDVIISDWWPLSSEIYNEEEEEEQEEDELRPIFEEPPTDDVSRQSTVISESEEEVIAVTHSVSEESIDAFTILNVSSVHLAIDLNRKGLALETRSNSSSTFSAIVLSVNDYEMHLYTNRSQRIVSTDDLEQLFKRGTNESCSKLLTTFCGELNAFALELAAAQPEHEIESIRFLLEAAFECFPDRDYCVLCIPSTTPSFPLLKHFTRVAPRSSSTYPQELYVLHRNVIASTMMVREARKTDLAIVEQYLANLSTVPPIMSCLSLAVYANDDYRAYVLLSEDQIVGLAIIREEDDVEYLQTHYDLTDIIDEDVHKPGSHGLLEHFVLAPMFQRHCRFFLREVHRLSDYTALYYCIYSDEVSAANQDRSLCCAIQHLIAVQARRTTEYSHTNFEGCPPSEVVQRKDVPFALFLSTARHCSLPRYEINDKIVVVGGSDTAIAFLDSLLRSTSNFYYATFTNVTVVSPHGLPYQKPNNKVRDLMFPKRTDFDYTYMQLTSLRTYVNVVHGVMTGIDRKLKLLVVNNVNILPYDMLFLLCGEQFQKPKMEHTQKKAPSLFPLNVFLVNTETDATNALLKLRELALAARKTAYTVIVYGELLEAYCCLASLLEFGIPGNSIVFIEPFPPPVESNFQHHVAVFNDAGVDDAVLCAIEAAGITIHKSYYFLDWVIDADTKQITCARFESRFKKISVDCIAMFMYNDKTVSTRTFLAINQAGLVFDGAVVIKPNCQTNDPNIYAAGTITKYSRKYYADHMGHKYFNLAEIGHVLGQQIRNTLIPLDCSQEADVLKCEYLDMLVPTYEKPLMTYCHLPDNLRYFTISKPGKQYPLEVAMSSDDYGEVLETGDTHKLDNQGYFRLHLSPSGIVETITCLAKFDIDYKNLTAIWGKHEKLLNNLKLRFEMAMITDLFDYFREPWCCAIYHDRFHLLEEQIFDSLTFLTVKMEALLLLVISSFQSTPGDSLVEDLTKTFQENDWKKLSFEQWEQIEEKFVESPYQSSVEQKVVDFIRNNNDFLSMYSYPELVNILLHGCDNSPLFQRQ